MGTTARRTDIQIIRIFSMLMIVFCHIIPFFEFIPGNRILSEAFSVGVYVFLLISGFLYGGKTVSDFRVWIRKRMQRIWLPEIVVSLSALVLLTVICQQSFSLLTWAVYGLNLQGLLFLNWKIFGRFISEVPSLGPLWFLTIIMLCYILLPFLQKSRRYITGRNQAAAVLAVLLVLRCILVAVFSFETIYFVVFITGYYFSATDCEHQISWKVRMSVIGLTAAAFQILRLVLHGVPAAADVYANLVGVCYLTLGMFILELGLDIKHILKTEKCLNHKVIDFLDGRSMYVYLVHGFFCAGAFNVFVPGRNFWVSLCLFLILTVIFSELVHSAVKFLSGCAGSLRAS